MLDSKGHNDILAQILEELQGLRQEVACLRVQNACDGLPGNVVDLKGEIASVRAAGGDLVQYFKDKARAGARA